MRDIQSTITRITCKLFALICLWSHHLTRLENWRGLFNVHSTSLPIYIYASPISRTCFSPCLVPTMGKRPRADFRKNLCPSCSWQNTPIFLSWAHGIQIYCMHLLQIFINTRAYMWSCLNSWRKCTSMLCSLYLPPLAVQPNSLKIEEAAVQSSDAVRQWDERERLPGNSERFQNGERCGCGAKSLAAVSTRQQLSGFSPSSFPLSFSLFLFFVFSLCHLG